MGHPSKLIFPGFWKIVPTWQCIGRVRRLSNGLQLSGGGNQGEGKRGAFTARVRSLQNLHGPTSSLLKNSVLRDKGH